MRNRSTEQNRRYWQLVAMLADKPVQGVNYTKEEWHLYLRGRFLDSESHRLPNGKDIIIPRETHNLDVDSFNEYLAEVEAWAATHDVWLDS